MENEKTPVHGCCCGHSHEEDCSLWEKTLDIGFQKAHESHMW